MKNSFLLFSILFLFSFNIAEAQTPTFAGIPDANRVLVVYNSLDQTSIDVKDYYQNARGIPESNIVPLLNLKDQDITIDGETHRVKIVQVTDIIQDSVNNANNAVTPTKHAWKYFLDNIAGIS